MTRINIVPVQELSTKHLVAEYREITRLPNNLKISLSRKKPFKLEEIPEFYTLGKGHVKFFYNKFKFLKDRFEALVDEMIRRDYNPNYRDSSIFDVEAEWFWDYKPTDEALEINRQRIAERLGGLK